MEQKMYNISAAIAVFYWPFGGEEDIAKSTKCIHWGIMN
jgi:hypothetical protein